MTHEKYSWRYMQLLFTCNENLFCSYSATLHLEPLVLVRLYRDFTRVAVTSSHSICLCSRRMSRPALITRMPMHTLPWLRRLSVLRHLSILPPPLPHFPSSIVVCVFLPDDFPRGVCWRYTARRTCRRNRARNWPNTGMFYERVFA